MSQTQKKRKKSASKPEKPPFSTETINAVFDQSPVGFVLYDNTGLFLKTNSSCLKIFGCKKDTFLKKYSLFKNPIFPKISKKHLNNNTSIFEMIFDPSTKNIASTLKNIIYLKVQITILKNPSLKLENYLLNIENITDQKIAEKIHNESERTLDTILRASPVGIGLVNENRKLGWANNLLLKMTGYTQNEILGKSVSIFYDKRKEFIRVGKELYADMRKHGMGEIDTVWKQKNGTLFNVHIHIQPIFPKKPSYGIITAVMDITERLKAVEKVKQSEEFLSNIFRSITDPLYVINKQYKIVRLNSAASKIYDYPTDKGPSHLSCYSSLHKKRYLCQDCPAEETFRTKKPAIRFQENILSGGNRIWTVTQAYPIFDESGNLKQVVIYVRNITKRKNIEERQNLTLEILHHLNLGGKGKDVLKEIVSLVKAYSHCDSVGIRLNETQGCYYITNGFSRPFLEKSNDIKTYDKFGNILVDKKGDPLLRCICGDVLTGKFATNRNYFTKGGSFWTNSLSNHAKDTFSKKSKNYAVLCRRENFESLALIPLKAEGKIVGLLQMLSKKNGIFNKNLIDFYERLGESIGVALQRIHSSQSLIESEQFLSAITDQSPISMWILDQNGKIVKMNHASQELFGIKNEKDIMEKYNIFQDEVFLKGGQKTSIEKVFKKGEKVEFRINYDLEKVSHIAFSESNALVLDITMSPIKESRGSVSHAVIMHKDITEISHLETQFRQSQKMEAIGRLAGGIAHDFNNILEIISGHVDLTRISDNQETTEESLNIIQQSVKRAADLTNKLLGFAREGKYRSEPSNVRTLIEDVYILISQTFDKRINITLNISPNIHLIEGDKGQLEQSLLNLCLNSKDAMPDGGKIILEAQNWIIDEEFVKNHIGAKKGLYTVIRVTDTGTGITEKIKPHIFEPFFTTKEKSYHSGMGLSMVYGIIKNHGGYIDVWSDSGKGTTFEIFLPALEQKKSINHFSHKKKTKKGTGTILLVDDEDLIRDLIRKILEANGYNVLTAEDGFAAEKTLKAHLKTIDLIVLDLIMPHMSGKEAFEKLQAISCDIPIIIVSGFSLNDDSQELISKGAADYLQKPFDLVKLLQSIRVSLLPD